MNYFLGIDAGTDNVLVADFERATRAQPTGLNHPVTGATAVTSDVWHHAAVTYDGTTWNLYLDGDLENDARRRQDRRAPTASSTPAWAPR